MTQHDDPNRESLGLSPAWEEGTGGATAEAAGGLADLTKAELVELAGEQGVKVPDGSTKADIIGPSSKERRRSLVAHCTTAELAAAVGKPEAGNEARLQACVDAAAVEIDHYIDAVEGAGPVGDPLANRVNLLRGVEWWKANEAAFGVIGWEDAGALRAPRDSFNRHAYELVPLKQQWGVA